MRSLRRSFWCGGNVGDSLFVQHSVVMKSGSSGIDCRQRKNGSKISQSSMPCSEIPSKVCGCGEQLLLLKEGNVKNNGRLFCRCRNWTVSDKLHLFDSSFFWWLL